MRWNTKESAKWCSLSLYSSARFVSLYRLFIFIETVLMGRRLLALVILLLSPVVGAVQSLTLERMFEDPSLEGEPPRKLAFSPDGQRITYLKPSREDYNRYNLWQYDIDKGVHSLLVDSKSLFAGEETLSDEEKARRERQRIFGRGIMEYSWTKQSDALLFPLNGDLYYYALKTRQATKLTNTLAFETDARFSPDGRFVSFIREQNIYIVNVETGKETQLTNDGKGTLKNGMAEFVAQEEMGRMTGYWWSPDTRKIAYLQIDESPVQVATRNEIYAEEIKLFEQRYPFTGTANVNYRLMVVDIFDQSKKIVPVRDKKDSYLARVKWQQDGEVLTYQWQSRDQQKLKLFGYHLSDNKVSLILEENSDSWVNLHDDYVYLKDNKHFIWASERDGYKHLYFYEKSGHLLRQLSKGRWVVDKIEHIDEKQGLVYFTGRKKSVTERHLYQLNYKTGNRIKQITKRPGYHQISFAKDGRTYIDKYSTDMTPPQVSLHSINGKRLAWMLHNEVNNRHPLFTYTKDFVKPRYGEIEASDGQKLHYRIYQPKQIKPGQSLPVIISVYGGPHAQRVVNRWSKRNLWNQYLVQRGFVVFQLDNRGSYHRGKAFESPIYKHLGEVELKDQIRGVDYLKTLPFVDPDRIGIYGHSYGGYMALMAMFKANKVFSAGVSGAPVTDWRLYDTHYTERYLGHPETNAQGYEKSAVFPYAKKLKGDLLIYHGMADDNVLFTHSTKVFKVLQNRAKHFEIMTYPGSKHSLRGKKVQLHMYKTITNFFERKLQDKYLLQLAKEQNKSM